MPRKSTFLQILIPSIVAVLGSGAIISAVGTYFFKPDILTQVVPVGGDLHEAIINVQNNGSAPAKDLVITVRLPYNFSHHVFSTENYTESKNYKNNPRTLQILTPRLSQGGGSIISIDAVIPKLNVSSVDYSVYTTYDGGSTEYTKIITKPKPVICLLSGCFLQGLFNVVQGFFNSLIDFWNKYSTPIFLSGFALLFLVVYIQTSRKKSVDVTKQLDKLPQEFRKPLEDFSTSINQQLKENNVSGLNVDEIEKAIQEFYVLLPSTYGEKLGTVKKDAIRNQLYKLARTVLVNLPKNAQATSPFELLKPFNALIDEPWIDIGTLVQDLQQAGFYRRKKKKKS